MIYFCPPIKYILLSFNSVEGNSYAAKTKSAKHASLDSDFPNEQKRALQQTPIVRLQWTFECFSNERFTSIQNSTAYFWGLKKMHTFNKSFAELAYSLKLVN